jgi:general secretion pathway protein D
MKINSEVVEMKQIRQTGVVLALIMGVCLITPLKLLAQPPGEPAAPSAPAAAPSAPAAAPQAETKSGYGAALMGGASIQYDAETGSLIVITDEDTNRDIDKVVKNLDQPVPQVLIKVLFLEVTHTKNLDLGVEGSYKYGSKADFANGTEDIIQTLFGLASETRGGFYKILDSDNDLAVTIRAIAEKTKLEVLSRPSVLVRNNQQATITVGQEVPFITNSRITENGDTLNTIQYEDIGIILTVTPHITSNNLVEMDVSPEISTLTGETVPISETVNARVIAKRSAATEVVVESGKTVVIGGMMEDNNTETVTKIPVLGDIPLLGMAFRRTVKDKSKTELLIFLTPYVVQTPAELRERSLAEKNQAELAPAAFTEKQIDKFIDNLKE